MATNASSLSKGKSKDPKKTKMKDEFHEDLVNSYDFFNNPRFWSSFPTLFLFSVDGVVACLGFQRRLFCVSKKFAYLR